MADLEGGGGGAGLVAGYVKSLNINVGLVQDEASGGPRALHRLH